MSDWSELKKRNEANIVDVMSQLTPDEQLIFQQVVDFELKNRHLHNPPYKDEIKGLVEKNIKLLFL